MEWLLWLEKVPVNNLAVYTGFIFWQHSECVTELIGLCFKQMFDILGEQNVEFMPAWHFI